jgi:hypothetical protein
MKSAAVERQVITLGVLACAEFGIDPRRFAHIMGILRSSLYTRKALAVLREYSSNGWDAHRMYGLADVPLKITLPTSMRPTFICRDFGPGMSQDDVLYTYTQYGASTKRGADPDCPDCAEIDGIASAGPGASSGAYCEACRVAEEVANRAVGALGIGSKSAFCMGDSFTVTSWHKGVKSVYVAALDKSNKGTMSLLHREDCGDDSGIEIKVAIPSNKVWEFEREARGLFRFMRPQPEINLITLEPLPDGLENGYIQQDDQSDWMGIMGCVPYRIDLDQMEEALTEAGIWEPLQNLGGGIYIPIGEVEFAAPREELQYTDETVAILVAKFKALIQDYLDDALSTLRSKAGSGWARRHKACFLAHGLKIPLPKNYGEWSKQSVDLVVKESGGKVISFDMRDYKKEVCHRLPVAADTRLLMHDPSDKRTLKGWSLEKHDRMIVPREGFTMATAQTELEALLLAASLDGVGIGLLTTRGWYPPAAKSSGGRTSYYNAKHKQHTFRLIGHCQGGTLSENWEKAKPAQEEHPYFIINRFMVRGQTGFYDTVLQDRALAMTYGLTFPADVYGYKSTQKRPIKAEDIENGVPYMTWRKAFFAPLLTMKLKAEVRNLDWSQLFGSLPYNLERQHRRPAKDVEDVNFKRRLPATVALLTTRLGPKHPVVRYFVAYLAARKAVRGYTNSRTKHLRTISRMFPGRNKRNAPQCALDRILAKYPMLTVKVGSDNDMHIFQTHLDLVSDYILGIDRAQN